MFCKLGFERFEGQLSAEDQIKLLGVSYIYFALYKFEGALKKLWMEKQISKYLDFKIGEVWTEIASELYYERIRPISPDSEILSQIQQEIEYKASTVLKKQEDCAEKKVLEENMHEAQFLNEFQAQQARQHRSK
jgi:hypothetical protein